MKEISAAFATLSQEEINDIERNGTHVLSLEGGEVVLESGDYEITSEDMPGWLVASDGKLTVALDITITDSLRREGVARELVNRIQNLRKDSGLEVTDKIYVVIEERPDIAESLGEFKDYVASQTLSEEITLSNELNDVSTVEWGNGEELKISISKR